MEDTDYTVDYTDDLLTIELKGALADATSLDITITRTLEGCVKIVPLLEGGAVPDESILEKVLEACNASDIRPLNPDQLRKRILCPSWGENLTGAFRVDVTKPVYTPVSDTQVAKFSGHLTVSHKTESEVV